MAARRSPPQKARTKAKLNADSKPAPRQRSLRIRGHVKDKPTIRSVASRAGVAVSTVSRVLNGGYASAPVKKRVEAAVRELGYAPSTTARSLVTGRTGSIGVVIESSQGPWFTQLLGGIEEELVASRYSVVLASLALRDRYDSSAVAAWISEHRVDGLIFVRYTKREQRLLRGAVKAGMPVVLLAPDEPARIGFTVRCRNVQAGQLLGQHLADLGHKRVAFAGGPKASLDSRDRLDGLRQSLADRGVKMAAGDISFGESYDPSAGIEFAERFLARGDKNRPTAVVLGNDAMALGFMRTALQRNLRIPDDIAVAGFDGIPDGALFWPSLTTVVQPTRMMGATACRALLERIMDPNADEVTTVEYGVQLAVRESTAGRAKKVTKRGRGR